MVPQIGSVHMLDLIEWTWTRFTPSGPPPTQDRFGSRASWLYEGKIYVFGGCTGTIFRVVVGSKGLLLTVIASDNLENPSLLCHC